MIICLLHGFGCTAIGPVLFLFLFLGRLCAGSAPAFAFGLDVITLVLFLQVILAVNNIDFLFYSSV